MKDELLRDELNRHYPMIGLSADWIYQTWLISGNMKGGRVIFENEDNGLYELLSFSYDEDEEQKLIDTLFIGTLDAVVKASKHVQ